MKSGMSPSDTQRDDYNAARFHPDLQYGTSYDLSKNNL